MGLSATAQEVRRAERVLTNRLAAFVRVRFSCGWRRDVHASWPLQRFLLWCKQKAARVARFEGRFEGHQEMPWNCLGISLMQARSYRAAWWHGLSPGPRVLLQGGVLVWYAARIRTEACACSERLGPSTSSSLILTTIKDETSILRNEGCFPRFPDCPRQMSRESRPLNVSMHLGLGSGRDKTRRLQCRWRKETGSYARDCRHS